MPNRIEGINERRYASKQDFWDVLDALSSQTMLEKERRLLLMIKLEENDDSVRCACGAPFGLMHCPNCGSHSIYCLSRGERVEMLSMGVPFRIRMIRCKRCKAKFSDWDRLFCLGLPKGLSVRATRVEDKVAISLQGLPEEERKAKIAELLGKIKK